MNKFDYTQNDRIILPELKLWGKHGVLDFEREHAQPFTVCAEIFMDLSPAAKSDDLSCALDYREFSRAIRRQVEKESYFLLETLAENLAAALLAFAPVKKVCLYVQKDSIEVDGFSHPVAVSISREKPESCC